MEANLKDTSILKPERVIADYLFKSDFYEIKTWMYDSTNEKSPGKGYNDCFCLMFVRNGNVLFDL
ncbi:MAG: hypothetical protein WCF67_10645, partial [Chitinophagaceae bacterium]